MDKTSYTGIVILNFNNVPDTEDCVRSILEHNTSPVKFIIVDNGSSVEDTGKQLESFCKENFSGSLLELSDSNAGSSGELPLCTLLLSETNDGYARGNNKGLNLAFRDESISHVIILNNDVVFESDIIPSLISYYSSLDNPGILTPLLHNRKKEEYNCARLFPDNWDVIMPYLLFNRNVRSIISDGYKRQMMILNDPDLVKKKCFEIDVPSGSFMFIGKDLFRPVGGFDPDTFLYYEEVILCRRLKRLGKHNYCIPGLTAFHKGAASTSKAGDVFLQRCNIESADVYFRKESHLTLSQHLVWSFTKLLWKVKFFIKRKELRK